MHGRTVLTLLAAVFVAGSISISAAAAAETPPPVRIGDFSNHLQISDASSSGVKLTVQIRPTDRAGTTYVVVVTARHRTIAVESGVPTGFFVCNVRTTKSASTARCTVKAYGSVSASMMLGAGDDIVHGTSAVPIDVDAGGGHNVVAVRERVR